MTQRKPVVFVTGASRGIGLGAATALLTELGAVVVAVSRTRSPEISKLAEEHPSDFLAIEADVKDEPAMRNAVAKALERFNHLDALILNAGDFELGRVGDRTTTTEAWRSLFDLNFFSVFYTVQEALPALLKSELGGRVICVSSSSAEANTPALGSYNASKAALNSFCRTLGAEEPSIVTVAVKPGMVDTKMSQKILGPESADKLDPAFKEILQKRQRMGQVGQPEDVGFCIASMALKASKDISGRLVSWDDDNCKDFRRT